jgi:hypothetical protein
MFKKQLLCIKLQLTDAYNQESALRHKKLNISYCSMSILAKKDTIRIFCYKMTSTMKIQNRINVFFAWLFSLHHFLQLTYRVNQHV